MNDQLKYFESFLVSRGTHVIHSDELWYEVRPFIFQTANYFNKGHIDPSIVYRNYLSIACRWFEQTNEIEADITLNICKPPYDLSSLSKKARNQTRRGLENFLINIVPPDNNNFSDLQRIYLDNLSRLKFTLRMIISEKKLGRNGGKLFAKLMD